MPSDELAPGEVRSAAPPGIDLAVWRTAGGDVVVCDARCPHLWSHLGHEGVVDGDELVCPAHFWRFGVDGTGSKRAMTGRVDPKGPVEVYPARERDGMIEVDLP
jgi:phenylpropionate dioxygenase-like ring-hydroxylating dioxygenase large terminal subunit